MAGQEDHCYKRSEARCTRNLWFADWLFSERQRLICSNRNSKPRFSARLQSPGQSLFPAPQRTCNDKSPKGNGNRPRGVLGERERPKEGLGIHKRISRKRGAYGSSPRVLKRGQGERNQGRCTWAVLSFCVLCAYLYCLLFLYARLYCLC